MIRALQIVSIVAGLTFVGIGVFNWMNSGSLEWNDFGLAAFFLVLPLAIRWFFESPGPKSD